MKPWYRALQAYFYKIASFIAFSPSFLNIAPIKICTLFFSIRPIIPKILKPKNLSYNNFYYKFKKIIFALYINHVYLLFFHFYSWVTGGTIREIQFRWKKLAYVLSLHWRLLTYYIVISGLSFYISGNVSGRPGKRKKYTFFSVGKRGYKDTNKYAHTKQFHTTLATSIINISLKITE